MAGIAPGLDGFIAAQQLGQQKQAQETGLLMKLLDIQRQQRADALAAEMRPLQIEALRSQIDSRKAATEAAAGQRQAQGALSGLLATGGYQGPVSAPTAVAQNDAEALRMVQEAEARGQPMGVNVPSPANVRTLTSIAFPAEYGKAQAAALFPKPAAAPTPFNLGPGQVRYDAQGNKIAELPAAPRNYPVVSTSDGIFERRPEGLVQLKGPDGNALKSPSLAGGGSFTPQALEFTAKQYLAGDRQAAQGFARSATARIALQNAIVDEAAKQGLSPEQTASKMAEFSGITAGSRTIGQRSANISLAANEAQDMINVVKETSAKFDRGNFVPWNAAIKAYESGTGSPEIAAFGASLNALVNVYARAINPTGVPTISDKEHARAVINSVQSPEQTAAVLGIINRELEIAKKAPQSVRQSLRNEVTGNSGSGIEAQVRASGIPYEPNVYDYRIMDGKVQRKPK